VKRLALLLLTLATPAFAGSVIDCKLSQCDNVLPQSAEQAADDAVLAVMDAQRMPVVTTPLPEPVFYGLTDWNTGAFQADLPVTTTLPTLTTAGVPDWAYALLLMPVVPVVLDGGGQRSTPLTEAPAAVPEPGTWLLMLMGFAAIGMAGRRRMVA
jgi:hypothetical protein